MSESKYMKILERAIGQLTESVTLTECIAEQCEKEEVCVELMADWIKNFKSLLHTIEHDAIKHKTILKEEKFQTVSISELF